MVYREQISQRPNRNKSRVWFRPITSATKLEFHMSQNSQRPNHTPAESKPYSKSDLHETQVSLRPKFTEAKTPPHFTTLTSD